jgi:hypothetical protein
VCDSKKKKKKKIKRKYWKRRRKKKMGLMFKGGRYIFGKEIVLIGGRLKRN